MFIEQTKHGGTTRPSVHPDGSWRILWVLPGLEQPEESVYRVVLRRVILIKRSWWEMNVACVGFDTRSCLTDTRLFNPVILTSTKLPLRTHLLVANLDSLTEAGLQDCDVRRCLWELSSCEWYSTAQKHRCLRE